MFTDVSVLYISLNKFISILIVFSTNFYFQYAAARLVHVSLSKENREMADYRQRCT